MGNKNMDVDEKADPGNVGTTIWIVLRQRPDREVL